MDIASLMSALQTTQRAKSTVRLSDRNVVELVNKLKQLGLLGDDLLYTINGKEYVTTDRLKEEIQRCLDQAGGRLSLVELPALVGVDFAHCEKQACLLVAASKGETVEVQGELIATSYFDAMAGELNDLLQEAGMMSLAEIAVHYSLSAELLTKTITKRVGTIIKGHMEGGLIYTPAYLRNIKAQLRGALRGTTSPSVVQSMIKELKLEGVRSGVVQQLIEELVSEGSVKGVLKGGGVSWMPAIHADAQQGAVLSFYQQNGWVGYDIVKKVGITNEKKYLRDTFPEGIALETAFVAPSLLAQLEGAVDEALSAESWIDVTPLLPSVLTPADTSALLQKVPALTAAFTTGGSKASGKGPAAASVAAPPLLLASSCVVSSAVIKQLQDKVDTAARLAAEKAIAERRAVPGASAAASSAAKAGPATSTAGNDDDDWGKGLSKKGGKKGGKSSGAKGGPAKGGAAKGGGAAVAPAPQAGGLSESEIQELVHEALAQTEGSLENDDVVEEIAKLLVPGSVVAYEKALQAVLTAGAEERRLAKEAVGKSFEDAFQRLALYSRGVEVFASEEATYSTLQKHLLRSVGTECVDLLFQFAKAEYQQGEEGPDAAASTLSATARKELLKACPPDVAASLNRASDLMSASNTVDVESGIEKAAGDIGIRLKKFDKKAEKAAVVAAREKMLDALMAEEEPATALSLLVPLLFIKANNKAINIPGKAIGAVLSKLKEQLPKETVEIVEEAHSQVFEYLKAQTGGTADASKAKELSEELAGKLPKLKALVTGGTTAEADE